MKKVLVEIRQGELEGARRELWLGRAIVGRDPGPGGLSLPGDAQISRRHGELFVDQGAVVYRNLSPNGTRLGRRPIEDAATLEPGAILRLGEGYVLHLDFEPPAKPGQKAPGEPSGRLSRGVLARPLVRVLLIAYLLALLAFAVFLGSRDPETAASAFQPVREAYSRYQPPAASPAELTVRLERAEQLVRELEMLERRRDWPGARQACRALMALDSDVDSPIYRFAAQRLGALGSKKGEEP